MEEVDKIKALLDSIAAELHTEIIFNKDSTNFWGKAQDYIFDNALLSFREGVNTLKEAVGEDKDMYNYMAAMIFRLFAQPHTRAALDQFGVGFDQTADDPVLGGFNFKAVQLSNVEKLLLFYVVHSDRITLALAERDAIIAEESKRGRKG